MLGKLLLQSESDVPSVMSWSGASCDENKFLAALTLTGIVSTSFS